MTEQEIALKKLGLTDEEIADVIECDRAIDKGEKLFEQTTEQKEASKKACAVGSNKGYTFTKRERKPNEDKRQIIEVIRDALVGSCDSLEITNLEREIALVFNGTKYKITLSAPRK